MDDKEKADLNDALSGQHSIITDLSRTVAGLQFSVLALAASSTNPGRLLAEVELLKEHLSTGMKVNNPDLYTAVAYQLDLVADRVKETNPPNGEQQ